MPRVSINKKQYMIKDFTGWVLQKMKMNRLKQQDIGDILGISQSSFSKRVEKCIEEGKNIFSYEEVLMLLKEFKATDEEILRLMKL